MGGKFSATTDFSRIKEVEAVIICVPTPLNKNREPDLSFVLDTGRAIAEHLAPPGGGFKSEIAIKKLVVLESTTYPGTTEEELRAVLEEGSGMKAGVDFHLAFSPEREDPGQRPEQRETRSPRWSAATLRRAWNEAMALYARAIDTVVPVSSCRVAEATQAAGEHFPQREHRAGERAEAGLCARWGSTSGR